VNEARSVRVGAAPSVLVFDPRGAVEIVVTQNDFGSLLAPMPLGWVSPSAAFARALES
jgi:hypothetical protein